MIACEAFPSICRKTLSNASIRRALVMATSLICGPQSIGYPCGKRLTKKQVGQVLDVLGGVIATQLGKKGSGIFILPGMLKITRVSKPARKAGKKPNPFKPGEMMDVKARAAHNVVKVRPLKKLKEMV
jgi:DNA-binding protein